MLSGPALPRAGRRPPVAGAARRPLGCLLLIPGFFWLPLFISAPFLQLVAAPFLLMAAPFLLMVSSPVLPQVATLLPQLSFPPSAGTAHVPGRSRSY